MKLVNLTPHSITIVLEESTIEIQPSGTVARVSMETCEVSTTILPRHAWGELHAEGIREGIPIIATKPGETIDLPDPQKGMAYIVSALVQSANPSRGDLFSPGDLVRDDQGRVIGCRNLRAQSWAEEGDVDPGENPARKEWEAARRQAERAFVPKHKVPSQWELDNATLNRCEVSNGDSTGGLLAYLMRWDAKHPKPPAYLEGSGRPAAWKARKDRWL